MKTKPYMTTDDLIQSVKRRISFPLSQNTLKYSDIVAFLNEEMQLNAVPTIRIEHEEYFIYKQTVDLVNGVSRYEIPNRAIGMTLRDLKYSDASGNFYDMSRIAPDDKAFFQQSNGSNQTISKYYLEGNEVVLTPLVQAGASGKLNFFIFLRPNALVNNDRAAIIQNFKKDIVVATNSNLEAGDKIYIGLGNNSPTPDLYIFEAVTVIDPLNPNYQFVIGATNLLTAINLNNAINAANLNGVSAAVSSNIVTVTYDDIYDTFTLIKKVNALNPQAFTIDNENVSINFNQLPSTYTDPETMENSSLYSVGSLVDFLQTNPGHRTYTYDIPIVAISGTVAKFNVTQLQTYLNNSSGGTLSFFNIKIGDYICLQNECIIPQIPPELHNALAERAASRVLMAIGDVQGYQISQSKLAEMNKYQETLIGSRVEGSVSKVFNRYSLLRLGKSRFRRRY